MQEQTIEGRALQLLPCATAADVILTPVAHRVGMGLDHEARVAVLLRAVPADRAAVNSVAEILEDFPALSEEHVRAAIAFAAAAARDDMPEPALAGS